MKKLVPKFIDYDFLFSENKIMKKILAITTMGMLCVSCSIPKPFIQTVDANNIPKDKAVLLMSMGSNVLCSVVSTAGVLILKKDSPPTLGNAVFGFSINSQNNKSQFNNELGNPLFLLVDPGDYYFYLSSVNNSFTHLDKIVATENFSIKPQEIKYVGEVYSTGCSPVSFRILDKRDRDIHYFKTINPTINPLKINYNLIKLKGVG